MDNRGRLIEIAVADVEQGDSGITAMEFGPPDDAVRMAPPHGLEGESPTEAKASAEPIRKEIAADKIEVPEVTKGTK